GQQVTFPGRPVDLALTEDGRTLVVKNQRDLVFLDAATDAVRQTLAAPVGFSVVGLVVKGERVYVSDARDHVRVAERQPDGRYQGGKSTELSKPKAGGLAHPAGLEKPRPDAKPVPVPQRHGEPSVFKHVIYVIKENRT